jgi:hypothetical protein
MIPKELDKDNENFLRVLEKFVKFQFFYFRRKNNEAVIFLISSFFLLYDTQVISL